MRDVETVRTPEATFHTRAAGRGPLVLLAADPPNVVEQYDALLAELAPHARAVVVELPGFGRSRLARGRRFDAATLAASVRSLLRALGAGPAVLVFPCVAAYVALRVAREEPAAVAGLVLPQAPSWDAERAWMRRVDSWRVLRTPLLGQAALALGAGAVARRWYRAALPRGADADAFAGPALAALRDGARFPLATAFQRLARDPPFEGSVAAPTLAVWGERDRTHRRSAPETLRAHAPDAEVLRMPTCGHFPELEAPQELARALAPWMARLAAAQP